jgi:4-hydroxythreonine-4-phosphate dehydrogenase
VLLITTGDPNGIGPEIIVKAIREISSPPIPIVIIGNKNIYKPFKLPNITTLSKQEITSNTNLKKGIYLLNIDYFPNKECSAGIFSKQCIDIAKELLTYKHIYGVITAPVNKYLISSCSNTNFKGHTEYLAPKNTETFMCAYSKKIKFLFMSTHIPLKEVVKYITKERLHKILLVASKFIKKLSIKGKITILGLNPHASEKGNIGDEDIKIKEWIRDIQNEIDVEIYGPIPSDTAFLEKHIKQTAIYIAMYHDQGFIPFKTLCFHNGINLTLNLPFIRTSPIYGTAYDIAHKGLANAGSMISAIKIALEFSIRFGKKGLKLF